jgi:PAS domain S-box-containing protein
VTPDNNLSLLLLQAFIGTATLAALVLAAVIQERERAEEVHARLSSIVECSDDAIISQSLAGVIENWNKGAERIFGYRPEEIVGQPLARLIPLDLQHEENEIRERLRRGERVDHFETRRVARDGRQIDVSLTVSAVRDSAGKIMGVSKIARDITDQKRGERALRQSEQFNRTIIQSSRDCINTLSLEGVLLWMSETGRSSFCIPDLAEVLGKSWIEFWQREDRNPARAAVEAAARGETGTFVGYFPVAGQPRWWDVRITPILDAAGKPETLLAVSRDVTERKMAEDQLATAQANLKAYAQQLEETVAARTAKLQETNEELEAFSYSLSHDMRAPLRAIQGYSQIVLDEAGERVGEPVTDYLKRIMSAAQRLDRLLQDVLAITRLSREEISLEPVNVEKLVEQIIFERPDLQSPQAEIIVEKPLLCMLAHEASLTQCLTNLINNAVKFVAPGVTPRVRIYTEPVGEQARLWVEDNGIGIESQEQRELFEMFHRIHTEKEYEGSGIGLAIVRKAVERMRGKVGLESEPGKGSRFWLQLKRADPC